MRPVVPSACLVLTALLGLSPGCGENRVAAPPAGPSWTRHTANPILSPGPPGSWDSQGVGSPFILQLDAITYAMWYTGRDSVRSQIGLATSTDGVRWTKRTGNPVLGPGAASSWEALGVADPCVLYEGSGFRMYYSGTDGTSRCIGLATSDNWLQWTRSAANPVLQPGAPGASWDDRAVGAPWVLRDGTEFRMWYGGRGAGVTAIAIGHARSTDGLFWTKDFAPVLDPEALEAVTTTACVVRSGTGYRIWYTAYHENSTAADPGVIDLAQSADGIECTFTETALTPGPAGAWDARTLRSACVLATGSTARMWYAAEAADRTGAIGLALSP